MSGLSYLMPFHFLDFLKIIIYFAHVLSGYFQFPKLCGCVVGVVVFCCLKNPFPSINWNNSTQIPHLS